MKVVVTGARGQLGTDLVKVLAEKEYDVIGLSRADLDITDLDSAFRTINQIKPDAVIHTAAYTKVDLAESHADLAFLINGLGTRNAVLASNEVGAKFCYISTDYVFDGENAIPYRECDLPNPLGVYGKTKLAGEEFVKSFSSQYFIVRTSWVYGKNGENFVKTMLRLAQQRDELNVVYDQIGSPTYTIDLACFLCDLIQTKHYGIYHASNTGSCSWYDFAKAIFNEAGISIQVRPIRSVDYPSAAPRPKNSVLDDLSIRCHRFQRFRHWKEALKEFLGEPDKPL